MTTKQARETLDSVSGQLAAAHDNLRDAVAHAQERLVAFETALMAYDYQALRDMGFLSRRQLEATNKALEVLCIVET